MRTFGRIALSSLVMLAAGTGCAVEASEETTSSVSSELTLNSALAGNWASYGGVGEIHELVFSAGSSTSFSGRLDEKLFNAAFVCPIHMAPCTRLVTGTYTREFSNTGTAQAAIKLRLTTAGAPVLEYYIGRQESGLGTTGTINFSQAQKLVLHKTSLTGPSDDLRRKANNNARVHCSDFAPTGCNAGFVCEETDTRDGTGSAVAARCVPAVANCQSATVIEPRAEFNITTPKVTLDADHATTAAPSVNNALWTIGRLVKNLVPSTNALSASDLFKGVFQSMTQETVAGSMFSNLPRATADVNAFLASLPQLPGAQLDMDRLHRSPTGTPAGVNAFSLAAVLYQPEIVTPDGAGSASFFFAVDDTAIIEMQYNLPRLRAFSTDLTAAESQKVWAKRFHELSSLVSTGTQAPYGPEYRNRLLQATNAFTAPGVKVVGASTPNGTALARVRVIENRLGEGTRYREFSPAIMGGAVQLVPQRLSFNTPALEASTGGAGVAVNTTLQSALRATLVAGQAQIGTSTFLLPQEYRATVAISGQSYAPLFTGTGLSSTTQSQFTQTAYNSWASGSSVGITHVRLTSATVGNASDLGAAQDRLSVTLRAAEVARRATVLRNVLCEGHPQTVGAPTSQSRPNRPY